MNSIGKVSRGWLFLVNMGWFGSINYNLQMPPKLVKTVGGTL